MVALEAMSAYSIQALDTGSTNLTVKLGTPGRQTDYTIVLTGSDDGIQKELEVHNHSLFQDFFFSSNRRNIGLLGIVFLMLNNHDR